jgi:hypothetical protein
VFEIRVLRKIFVVESEDVTGGWRQVHNVELLRLYSSQNIIWMTNQGGRDGQCMWHTWGQKYSYWVLVMKLKKSVKKGKHMHSPSLDGRMILKWILKYVYHFTLITKMKAICFLSPTFFDTQI